MRSTPNRVYDTTPRTTIRAMTMVMKTGCLMETSAILMGTPCRRRAVRSTPHRGDLVFVVELVGAGRDDGLRAVDTRKDLDRVPDDLAGAHLLHQGAAIGHGEHVLPAAAVDDRDDGQDEAAVA